METLKWILVIDVQALVLIFIAFVVVETITTLHDPEEEEDGNE